jgi:hypothetical protein
MKSTERTFVGYATSVSPPERPPAERDGAPESGERVLYRGSDEQAVLTRDMVEELRAKLRAAEEAEAHGSGVFRRTPANGLERVEAIQTLPTIPEAVVAAAEPTPEPRPAEPSGELDAVIAAVPELEAALAPNSESNFYAGFDEEHPDGVFVATYQRFDEGTPVYVDIVLPAGYRFRTPAVVEWIRDPEAADPELPAGIGLRMCGLDHAKRRLIRAYAKHRKPIFWVG